MPVVKKAARTLEEPPAEEAPAEPEITFEPAPAFEEAIEAAPRWRWDATGDVSREATHGRWRLRVAQGGGDGLWRPFAEYLGEGFATDAEAEAALDELLR